MYGVNYHKIKRLIISVNEKLKTQFHLLFSNLFRIFAVSNNK